jgi:hypothetical protein
MYLYAILKAEGFFEENLDCPTDALTPKALRPAVKSEP